MNINAIDILSISIAIHIRRIFNDDMYIFLSLCKTRKRKIIMQET